MNFTDALRHYRKIAIVGTAKNAGKTIALNEFINIALERSLKIGITSIGRDGERKDILMDTAKPPIFASRGTIIATAEGCLPGFTSGYELIDITPYNTAMGRVVICRTVEDGYIEAAGPDSNSEIRGVCNIMESLGAEIILIDGALNRKTQASPAVADGVVLSTGAVLSRTMEKAIQRTRHSVKMLSLPETGGDIREICGECAKSSYVSFIDKNGNAIPTDYKTALGCGDKIICEIREDYDYIVLPGTLTGSFIKAFMDVLKEKKITIVVQDGTKVFLDYMDYMLFEKMGGRIEVIDPINLIAVTVNPYSPEGYYFEPSLFLEAMREALYPLDVFDCMLGGVADGIHECSYQKKY